MSRHVGDSRHQISCLANDAMGAIPSISTASENEWTHSENCGLWKHAWRELRGAPNRWQIWKVKSHRRIEDALSDEDIGAYFTVMRLTRRPNKQIVKGVTASSKNMPVCTVLGLVFVRSLPAARVCCAHESECQESCLSRQIVK